MLRSLLISSWGMMGVAAFILRALLTLTPIALEPIQNGSLSSWHWVLLCGWVVFSVYAEGYRGFHRSFSPRVVGRAMALGDSRSWLRVLFAAPYCMGLFDAPRGILIRSWVLVFAMICIVIFVRQLAQPWRGIIDAGVVVGLGTGLLSMLFLFARAIADKGNGYDNERAESLS